MADFGRKKSAVKVIGKKVMKYTPMGLKYGGRALTMAGTYLGRPEAMALGAGMERVGSMIEK